MVTGTDFLHRHFERMGLKPKKICDADIQAISSDNEDWGTYYDTKPRVLVGQVGMGVKKLKTAFGTKFEDCRPRLLQRLHYRAD